MARRPRGRQPRLSRWGEKSATAIFERMYDHCECIVTSSNNFGFQAVCKVQLLLASMFCLCFELAGSKTWEAAILPLPGQRFWHKSTVQKKIILSPTKMSAADWLTHSDGSTPFCPDREWFLCPSFISKCFSNKKFLNWCFYFLFLLNNHILNSPLKSWKTRVPCWLYMYMHTWVCECLSQLQQVIVSIKAVNRCLICGTESPSSPHLIRTTLQKKTKVRPSLSLRGKKNIVLLWHWPQSKQLIGFSLIFSLATRTALKWSRQRRVEAQRGEELFAHLFQPFLLVCLFRLFMPKDFQQ